MTTLIVGCGYLGRRVAARLLERGDRVLGTTRSAAWAGSLDGLGVEPVVVDLTDEGAWRLPEADRVVYCVGYDRTSGHSMRSVYVDGLRRFFERTPAVGRLVYASSTGVYGRSLGGWVDEDSPTEPESESGRVCLDAEHEALDKGASVVRLAGLYGPGRIIRRAAVVAGEPVSGDPEGCVNLIQIDDAATAIIAALDRGSPGRLTNAADDRAPTRRELYTLTARLLDVMPPTFDESAAGTEPIRRVANRRLKAELGVTLHYPDIAAGLPASIAAEG